MKPERIIGTYRKTFRKLCMSQDRTIRPVVFVWNGRVRAGQKSAHLSRSGRRIAKLLMLRLNRIRVTVDL